MQPAESSSSTPVRARWSSGLLWVALVLGVLLQFMYADWDAREAIRTLAGGMILVFALHGYLIYRISRGRSSARLIYLLFFFGGLAFAPPNVLEFWSEPLLVSTEVAQVTLQAVAFVLLFTPAANEWFKGLTAVRAQ